jgi:hypothetical protein
VTDYDWIEWCAQRGLAGHYDRGVMVGECADCGGGISAKSIWEGWANETRCWRHGITQVTAAIERREAV